MTTNAVACMKRASFRGKGRAVTMLALSTLSAGLVACGGGGGGSPAVPVVVVPPPKLLALANAQAAQAPSATPTAYSLLGFRVALRSDATLPGTLALTYEGGVSGATCASGVDFLTGPASLTLDSGSAQVNLQVCPGAATTDKTITVRWNDGGGTGVANGTIRGSANTAYDNSKRLNDTGITTCGTATAANLACPQAGLPGQDGETGREATANVVGQGSYRNPAFQLTALPGSTCIQDGVTGLVWEGKAASGLHAAGATYTWRTAAATNGGAPGTANGGVCSVSGCDTDSFVAAVNAEAWCGFKDWRLPTADELSGIVDAGATSAPTIRAIFANQQGGAYWSASPKAQDSDGAWIVDFSSGAIGAVAKSSANRVRLVRGR